MPKTRRDADTYDAGGRVTRTVNGRGQVLGLTWNLRGELVSVSTNGVFAEGYAYDPMGRRISTTDANGTVYHAYDGIHCVADLAPDGTLLRSYTWGSGVDNLLAVTLYGCDATNTLYAVTDPLGTVHALVGTNGVPAVTYAYDSWGNLLSVSGGESLVPSLRFTWQCREYSHATGLYSFRARWYDPAAGRWLSKDPIGLEGGLNLYEAFGNNPVCLRDPDGAEIIHDGNIYMETIRGLIDQIDQEHPIPMSATGDKMATALVLHGGFWSPFDFKGNGEKDDKFLVNDEKKMKGDEFGNYLAGYSAGYSLNPCIYLGVRLGGFIYAVGENIHAIFSKEQTPEHWTDKDSAPAINRGLIRGVKDRIWKTMK